MKYGIVTVSDKGIVSKIIQLLTFSKWNHVAFYINNYGYSDIIVEMNFNGIQFFEREGYCKDKDVIIHKNTPKISLRRAINFINKNKDKKYDFLKTIFFFYSKKNIDDTSRWNCIEFVDSIFKDQNVSILDHDKMTPSQINNKYSSDDDLIFLNK